MHIKIKKFLDILERKTNKAIEHLDSLKCSSEEYQILLSAVLKNLEAIEKAKSFDSECPDCKDKMETSPVEKENSPEVQQPQPESPQSAIGRKFVSMKKEEISNE